MCQDSSARTCPDSSARMCRDRCPSRSVARSPDSSARTSRGSSATMSPDRSPGMKTSLSLTHSLTHISVLGRSATVFPVNSAQTFPASSVTMFPDSSAGTFPLRSVPTFLARSAATFPGSSASRSLSRCVRPPSQATETESRGLQSQQKSFPRNWVDPSQPISLPFHHLPYLFRHYLILHEAFINTRKYILK